jgi:hypothetical protein
MMTRQHFKIIAEAIKNVPELEDDKDLKKKIVNSFCNELRNLNPNFNSEIFAKACY